MRAMTGPLLFLLIGLISLSACGPELESKQLASASTCSGLQLGDRMVGLCRAAESDASEERRLADRMLRAADRFAKEPPVRGAHAMRVRDMVLDTIGDVHVVLDAERHGYRVLGAERVLHDRDDGSVARSSWIDLENYEFDDTPPSIERKDAEELAREHMLDQGARVESSRAELLYELDDEVYRLVYRVDVQLDPSDTSEMEWLVWIDPTSGELRRRANVSRAVEGVAQPTQGIGHTVHYGTVGLKMDYYQGEGYTLDDRTRPRSGEFLSTRSYYTAQGTQGQSPYTPFWSQTNVFGNHQDTKATELITSNGVLSVTGQSSGAEAHYSAGWSWDLYVNVFNRFGPYGNGDTFDTLVHYPYNPRYNHSRRQVFLRIRIDQSCGPTTDVETAAHEIAHGFFQSVITTSIYAGETGGIDEANSDIIGKLTEIYRHAGGILPPTWSDWKVRLCGLPLRDMQKPSIDNHSFDAASPIIEVSNADAHYASGPINRMFFFLSQGVAQTRGTVPANGSQYLPSGMKGIGIPAAADIYFRGVTAYLKRVDPKYADLRAALEQAATTSTHKKAVQDAFAAVNIGQRADRQGPTVSNIPSVAKPGQPFGATVSDPSGVAKVKYSTTSGVWGTATSAPWSITAPSYTPGMYTVDVCATDTMDNETCASASVTLDGKPPVISLFNVPDPYIAFNNRTVQLSASDSPGRLKSLSIDLQSTAASSCSSPATCAAQAASAILLWEQSWPAPYTVQTVAVQPSVSIPTNWPEGIHKINARAVDWAGNETTKTLDFFWDKSPPHICTFTGLSSVMSTSGEIRAQANDAVSGILKTEIFIDNTLLVTTPHSGSGGQLQGVQKTYSAATGSHTLRLVCYDRAGHTRTAIATVTLNAPPYGGVAMQQQTSTPTQQATYYVNMNDSDGLVSVTSSITCTSSGTRQLPSTLSGQPKTYGKSYTTTGLVVGETCRVYVTAKDTYNLTRLITYEFTVVSPGSSGTPCNVATHHTGSNQPSSYTINVGKKSGTVLFQHNTYAVADTMLVSCADGGSVGGMSSWTTGCASTSTWAWTNLTFACTSNNLRVSVMPNCAGSVDTAWDFILGCAQ